MFPDNSKHYEDLQAESIAAARQVATKFGDDETRRIWRASSDMREKETKAIITADCAITEQSEQYKLCADILLGVAVVRGVRLAEENVHASLVARRDAISETLQREPLTTEEANALIEELAAITNYLGQNKTDEAADDYADMVFANRRGEGL